MGKLTLSSSVSYFISQFLKQTTYTKFLQLPLLELIKVRSQSQARELVGGKTILSSTVLALDITTIIFLKMYNKKNPTSHSID